MFKQVQSPQSPSGWHAYRGSESAAPPLNSLQYCSAVQANEGPHAEVVAVEWLRQRWFKHSAA